MPRGPGRRKEVAADRQGGASGGEIAVFGWKTVAGQTTSFHGQTTSFHGQGDSICGAHCPLQCLINGSYGRMNRISGDHHFTVRQMDRRLADGGEILVGATVDLAERTVLSVVRCPLSVERCAFPGVPPHLPGLRFLIIKFRLFREGIRLRCPIDWSTGRPFGCSRKIRFIYPCSAILWNSLAF